ncbi:hypothetical protein AXG93_167s1280 [Marchantia polymorpha subsp. ruderalis]|uniref:Uncharacterized protein n=1 Tax=Marchantia polymorpha subsp. ruderalis TaxID=1480154 RepID=A0A176WNB4_MARPO|nr:hypothetical protein AXG93_167s1280 [Marchantia polymorpha subsp. ruderalis]
MHYTTGDWKFPMTLDSVDFADRTRKGIFARGFFVVGLRGIVPPFFYPLDTPKCKWIQKELSSVTEEVPKSSEGSSKSSVRQNRQREAGAEASARRFFGAFGGRRNSPTGLPVGAFEPREREDCGDASRRSTEQLPGISGALWTRSNWRTKLELQLESGPEASAGAGDGDGGSGSDMTSITLRSVVHGGGPEQCETRLREGTLNSRPRALA